MINFTEKLLRNPLRNVSTGHPTKSNHNSVVSYNHINRSTLSKRGFELMTFNSTGWKPKFTFVDIEQLILNQYISVQNLLEMIIKKLEEEEMKHKEEFKEQKLRDVFPATLGYHFEKINEGILRKDYSELGKVNVFYIEEIIDNFKKALEQRGILTSYDSINYLLDIIKYPLSELHKYLEDPGSSTLNNEGAYIFSYFVYEQIKELQKVAQELDEEYSK